LLEGLPDAVLALDVEFRVVWGNAAAERLFGLRLADWLGASAVEMLHPDDAAFAAASMETVQGKTAGSPVELRVQTAGGWRLVAVVGAPVPDLGVVVFCIRDLTERRRWEVAGDEVSMVRSLVHNSAALTMLLSAAGGIRSASGALTRSLGWDPEQIQGDELMSIVHPDDRAALTRVFARPSRGQVCVEVRMRTRAGGSVPYELSIVNLLDDPVVHGFVISGHDITQLRDAQRRLEELANRDALTGLPNRAFLDRHVAGALHRVRTAGHPVVVAFVDLDRFKPINDRFGHDIGDQLLCLVGARLAGAVRDGDIVARFGGDEFVVVASLPADEAPALAARLELAVAEPFQGPDGAIRVSASVGWAVASSTHTVASLISEADARMYVAKRSGMEPGLGGYEMRRPLTDADPRR